MELIYSTKVPFSVIIPLHICTSVLNRHQFQNFIAAEMGFLHPQFTNHHFSVHIIAKLATTLTPPLPASVDQRINLELGFVGFPNEVPPLLLLSRLFTTCRAETGAIIAMDVRKFANFAPFSDTLHFEWTNSSIVFEFRWKMSCSHKNRITLRNSLGCNISNFAAYFT